MTSPSSPTPPPAGPRPCVRCRAVWRRCPARRATPPTCASRLAQFYERAGRRASCLGSDAPAWARSRAIGAVSPPGGDISRARRTGHACASSRCSGALDASLAYAPPLPGHQLAELLFAVSQTPCAPWFDEQSERRVHASTATKAMQHAAAGERAAGDRPARRHGRAQPPATG